MKATSLCALLLLVSAVAVQAQWAKQRDPRIPTRDGQANLTAPAPRASDGKPDLSGVWLTDGGPVPKDVPTVEGDELRISRQFIDVTAGMKPEQVQMEPWAAELFKKRVDTNGALDPLARCQPAGEPGQPEIPLPYKIVQTPRLIIVLYGKAASTARSSSMDARWSRTPSLGLAATLPAGGRATPWWSRRLDSTTGPGWTASDIRIAMPCA